MGKKYIMFVDERGFFSTDIVSDFSMIGVIFEYDYCVNLKNKQCELKRRLNRCKEKVFSNSSSNTFLDDIIIKEDFSEKIDGIKRKEFINELPFLLKGLEFTIISSAIKQDINNVKESYSIVTKNLLKSFNSFITKKNGECGGIIMEARDYKTSYTIQQSFFDIYNERSRSLIMVDDIKNKINTFILSEKDNKRYGVGIEVSNILNNIMYRVSNELRKNDIKYYNEDKIFNEIKPKIYKDKAIHIYNKHLQKISCSSMEIFNKKLKALKKQLKLKEIKINEKEKQINELSDEIHLLNQQLEEELLSRKSDNIIFQILSDIDFKMKGLEKKSRVAKN